MHYRLSFSRPHAHFLEISFTVTGVSSEALTLQLPAWRPGRYQLANFAQNIQQFAVFGPGGESLAYHKQTKDCWVVATQGHSQIEVRYNYFANQQDAGGSYLDAGQCQVNPVTCLLSVVGREEEACRVSLDLPSDYTVATGLEKLAPHDLQAPSYWVLASSPILASGSLRSWQYEEQGHTFFIWIQGPSAGQLQGNGALDEDKMLADFRRFTAQQLQTMGAFPCQEYHFLIQLYSFPYYHGVEYWNSTLITLGPDYLMHTEKGYDDLMGVASHELFHTWNIIRIRPKELVPYPYAHEVFFNTGYVAEGFTTYYGDYFLLRSGVFDLEWFMNTMNVNLQRHFQNGGRHNRSLMESSVDLWLDGYQLGIPDRKVSIYAKGAIVAFMLDLTIRLASGQKRCLDDVARTMWQRYGELKEGYTHEEVKQIAEEVAGQDLTPFFNDYYEGTVPVEEGLIDVLAPYGLRLKQVEPRRIEEGRFGICIRWKEGVGKVWKVVAGSPAAKWLVADDELVAVNGRRVTASNMEQLLGTRREMELTFFRQEQLHMVRIAADGKSHHGFSALEAVPNPSEEQRRNLLLWTQGEVLR